MTNREEMARKIVNFAIGSSSGKYSQFLETRNGNRNKHFPANWRVQVKTIIHKEKKKRQFVEANPTHQTCLHQKILNKD